MLRVLQSNKVNEMELISYGVDLIVNKHVYNTEISVELVELPPVRWKQIRVTDHVSFRGRRFMNRGILVSERKTQYLVRNKTDVTDVQAGRVGGLKEKSEENVRLRTPIQGLVRHRQTGRSKKPPSERYLPTETRHLISTVGRSDGGPGVNNEFLSTTKTFYCS